MPSKLSLPACQRTCQSKDFKPKHRRGWVLRLACRTSHVSLCFHRLFPATTSPHLHRLQGLVACVLGQTSWLELTVLRTHKQTSQSRHTQAQATTESAYRLLPVGKMLRPWNTHTRMLHGRHTSAAVASTDAKYSPGESFWGAAALAGSCTVYAYAKARHATCAHAIHSPCHTQSLSACACIVACSSCWPAALRPPVLLEIGTQVCPQKLLLPLNLLLEPRGVPHGPCGCQGSWVAPPRKHRVECELLNIQEALL